MPATRTATAARRAARRTPHALTLLKDEHKTISDMFERYEKTKDKAGAAERRSLAGRICDELERHAEMEEAIFYPALREAMDDEELLDEAQVEHDSAKQLIAEIRAMKPSENLYDAKVKVLGEYVKHHVKEEEKELFKEARSTDLDFGALGEEMARYRAEAGNGGRMARRRASS